MILIAPDKFKGSLTARQVCEAITEALISVNPSLDIVSIPFADGGEGTCDLLTEFARGTKVNVTVLDPLFREIDSCYGISADGSTAFIEMANASGLQLVRPADRNPLITTTVGTGQLIAHAVKRGIRKFIFGVGGSATNDAGMGMAVALGYQFLSSGKEILKPIGQNLIHVEEIVQTHVLPGLTDCEFTIIFDVQNPLYGKQGAAHIFASQKGASEADIDLLDRGLVHFAAVVQKQFNVDVNFPGAGAGGGLVAVAKLVLRASFSPGIDFIIQFTNLEHEIQRAALVITGEGKIDEQTLSGKVVKGVAQLSAKHKKKCVAFSGKCDLSREKLSALGLGEIITLVNSQTSEQEAVENAYSVLKDRAVQFLQQWISNAKDKQ